VDRPALEYKYPVFPQRNIMLIVSTCGDMASRQSSPAPEMSVTQKSNSTHSRQHMKVIVRNLVSPTILGLLALAIVTTNASALTIDIDPFGVGNPTTAQVYDSNLNLVSEDFTSASIPGFSASYNPTIFTGPNGATYSTGTAHVSASGNGYGYVFSYGYFTADEDTTYSWTGNLSGTSGGGQAEPFLDVDFQDVSGGGDIMHATQFNPTLSGDYSFDLTGPSTAEINLLAGSLSGTIEAEHTYFYLITLQTEGFEDGSVIDGTGNVTLQIGAGASSVPDAGSTLALLGVAMSGIAVVRSKWGRV
jgi:hypothetical protein